jgi:hypothetical protein
MRKYARLILAQQRKALSDLHGDRRNSEPERDDADLKKLKPQPLTRSERRAAEVDLWVKQHVAELREADAAKKSRLRELRLGREASNEERATRQVTKACTMQTEQYGVGDRVLVSSGSFSGPTTTDEFEIMALYAVENYEPMYRLLSLRDRAERMVPQSELRMITTGSPRH